MSAGTAFTLDVPPNGFDRGMQLLAADVLQPRFSAADFDVVKTRTVSALTGQQTGPDHLTAVALASALYPPGDPARRFATPQSVSGLTLGDVKAWYTAAYRPDLATIVIVGDVTPDQAEAAVRKYFGGWHASGPKPEVYPPAAAPNAPSDAVIPATGAL